MYAGTLQGIQSSNFIESLPNIKQRHMTFSDYPPSQKATGLAHSAKVASASAEASADPRAVTIAALARRRPEPCDGGPATKAGHLWVSAKAGKGSRMERKRERL